MAINDARLFFSDCIGSDEVPFNATRKADFANCNLVEGSIIINADSWTGPDAIVAADLEVFQSHNHLHS